MPRDALGIDPEYYSLIGELCINWNMYEETIAYFITFYMKDDPAACEAILAGLDNKAKCRLLAWMIKTQETKEIHRKSIALLLTAFAICEENRNILIHSAVRLESPSSIPLIEKRSRTNIGAKIVFEYDLSVIRERVFELKTAVTYAYRVLLAILLPLARYNVEMDNWKGGPRPTLKPLDFPAAPKLPTKMEKLTT